jgi:hypothetical protein
MQKRKTGSADGNDVMSFELWAAKLEKEQGVSIEEAVGAMGLTIADAQMWEKKGQVPAIAVRFVAGLEMEAKCLVPDADPEIETKPQVAGAQSTSGGGCFGQDDRFGLNALLRDSVLNRMVEYDLVKGWIKGEYNSIKITSFWLDPDHFRLVISVEADSKKPVFKGDNAYSMSGYVFVKFKDALLKDDSRTADDVGKILAAFCGRQVCVNGATVFEA